MNSSNCEHILFLSRGQTEREEAESPLDQFLEDSISIWEQREKEPVKVDCIAGTQQY